MAITIEQVRDLAKSSKSKPTPCPIVNLVFSIVGRALTEHYGNDSSVKCVQSSFAISSLLQKYGIDNSISAGYLCVPDTVLSWGGYWGDDDMHTWVYTDRNEIVDLTINRLHLRPLTISRGDLNLKPPAFWWHDNAWPYGILYVLKGFVRELGFENEDAEDFSDFMRKVSVIEEIYYAHKTLARIKFGPVVREMSDMEQLLKMRHPFASTCYHFQSIQLPIPAEIAAEMNHIFDGTNYCEP